MSTKAMSTKQDRSSCGSPLKVSCSEAARVAREEGTPVYKARRICFEADFKLAADELLITHKKIETDVQCAIALSKLGCGEEVLVIEGLHLLEEEFDSFLQSKAGMRIHADDSRLIFLLASKGSLQNLLLAQDAAQKLEKGEKLKHNEEVAYGLKRGGWRCGIAKFVHGLVLAAQDCQSTDPRLVELDRQVKRAAKTTGAAIFKEVLENVVSEHEDNLHMQELLRRPRDVLAAWNEVYQRRVDRNIKSHPFLMIDCDVDTAVTALGVFEFLLPKYPKLEPLMRASIQLTANSINDKKERQLHRKIEEERNINSVADLLGIL